MLSEKEKEEKILACWKAQQKLNMITETKLWAR